MAAKRKLQPEQEPAVAVEAPPATASPANDLKLRVVEERKGTVLGDVTLVKIHADPYRPLGWDEVWERFAATFPGKWAVQCFPPSADLVNGKACYILWVCDEPPKGLNAKEGW